MNIAIPRRFGDVRGMEDVKIEKVKKLSVSNQRRLHYESLYSTNNRTMLSQCQGTIDED
jgi:hypothetical protein